MSTSPIWTVLPPGSRKPRFSREQIAATALALADKEGFDALSMRRIAEDLGAGTMTLYHYVRTKDDLLALIDDALMAEVVAASTPLPADWRAALGVLARATRDTFVRHPWALHSLQGARVGPNSLRHMEQSLTAVASLRCDLATKLALLSIVDDYVFGHVLRVNETQIVPPADAKTARLINEFTTELLNANDFPQLTGLIGDDEPVAAFTKLSKHVTSDQRFDIGLEAMLDGLALRLRLDHNAAHTAARHERSGTARRIDHKKPRRRT